MIWAICATLCLYGFFGNERGWLARWLPAVLTLAAGAEVWLILGLQFIEASSLFFSTLLFYTGATRHDSRH